LLIPPVRPTTDGQRLDAAPLDEVPDCEPEAFNAGTVRPVSPPRRSGAGHQMLRGVAEALLELARAREAAGCAREAPWPRTTRAAGGGARPAITRPGVASGAVRPRLPGKGGRPNAARRTTVPLIEIAPRARTEKEGATGSKDWKFASPRGVLPHRTRRHPGRRDARPSGVVSNPSQGARSR